VGRLIGSVFFARVPSRADVSGNPMRGKDRHKSFYTQMFFPSGHRACTLYCRRLALLQFAHRAGTDALERGCLRSVWRLVVVLSMLSISPRTFDILGGKGRHGRFGRQQE